MGRPIEFQHRRKALALPDPNTGDIRGDPEADPINESGTTELLLHGRRYRLVPIERAPPEAAAPPAIVDLLTARELQIVALVAEGRVNKQIADGLRISEFTVSTHLRRIFAKLGVDTRAAMVSRCLKALADQH